MTAVAQGERGGAARVLRLLQVEDLETLRERSKMLSVEESVDLLIPVIAALTSESDDDAAHVALQPALGVALFQALVRERLAGPSLDVVVAQVVSGQHKKPRQLDKSIPRSLEAVITRATRELPDERFSSLRALGAALLPFASKHVRQSYGADFPGRGAGVEATLLRRLERGDDLKLLAAALAIALPFVLATRQRDEPPVPTPPVEQPTSPPAPERSAAREPAPAPTSAPASAPAEPALAADEAPTEPERARAEVAPDRSAARVAGTYAIDVAVEPSTAWIMLDSKAAGRGRLRRELVRDGKAHALHVGAPGYQVQALHFTDAPPPTSVVLAKRVR